MPSLSTTAENDHGLGNSGKLVRKSKSLGMWVQRFPYMSGPTLPVLFSAVNELKSRSPQHALFGDYFPPLFIPKLNKFPTLLPQQDILTKQKESRKPASVV